LTWDWRRGREEEVEQSAQKTSTGGSDLKEHGRVDRAGIEDEASDLYSVDVGYGKSSVSVLRDEGSITEPEDGGVGIEDVDGGLELVDAIRAESVLGWTLLLLCCSRGGASCNVLVLSILRRGL
jgi:hypothetical protein